MNGKILGDWKKVAVITVVINLVATVAMVFMYLGHAEDLMSGVTDNKIYGIILFIFMFLISSLLIGFALISVEKKEQASTAKSDKYKKLFLNLPIGFAQAEILRESGSGHISGYRIADANETFGDYFNLDNSD